MKKSPFSSAFTTRQESIMAEALFNSMAKEWVAESAGVEKAVMRKFTEEFWRRLKRE